MFIVPICKDICFWRNEDNFRIDWSKDSEYILRFINALSEPYKGASSYFNGKLCRILKAETVTGINGNTRYAIPIDKLIPILEQSRATKNKDK